MLTDQVIATSIIVVERPMAASMSLLVLYVGLFLERLVMLSHGHFPFVSQDAPIILAAVTALFGILIVLNMPLRDPALPRDDISPVYTKPTIDLRTPEDDLTPFQYMTVSWMRPLIKKGNTRDMNDEDVWDLGYVFKHERLHSAFRVLQGSVTKRLFFANGMDLLITTLIGLLQLVLSKASPIIRSTRPVAPLP